MPTYIAQMEVQKLSIGFADFTCCQRNHIIVTETQKILAAKDDDEDEEKKEEIKTIPCDKPIAGRILKSLIRAKIHDLYVVFERTCRSMA